MITRRRFLASSALALTGASSLARAQAVNKAGRIVIGYPAGGSIDAVARALADKLRGPYTPTMVVDNRPGNRAAVAMQALFAAPADGANLLMAPHSIVTVWPHVYKNLTYDALNGILPVSMVSFFDFAWVVRPDVPAQNLAEYAEWVKQNPKQNGLFGITGAVGGTPHWVGVLFSQAAGIQLTPVPYKGTVQGITDLIGGQTPAWVGPLGDIERFAAAGKARILATTGEKRSKFVPNVPTFFESGFRTVLWQERFGVWLRGGASPETLQAANRAVRAALDTPDVKGMCEKFTSEALGSTPAEFDAIIRREHARMGKVIAATAYQPED